jgi:hypothetical protein
MAAVSHRLLRKYLDHHQNNPTGQPIGDDADEALQAECERVWGLMQRLPDSYTPSDLEARVWNAIADNSRKSNRNAQMAVARHWNARVGEENITGKDKGKETRGR